MHAYSKVVFELMCLAKVRCRLRAPTATLVVLVGALEKSTALHGNSHQETAGVLRDFWRVYYEQGDIEDAITMFELCLIINRNLAEHLGGYENITTAMTHLSRMLFYAYRFQEALKINFEITHFHASGLMTIDQSLFLADMWVRMGLIYSRLDFLDEAINCYKHALKTRIDELNNGHSSVPKIMHMIGVIHVNKGPLTSLQKFFTKIWPSFVFQARPETQIFQTL